MTKSDQILFLVLNTALCLICMAVDLLMVLFWTLCALPFEIFFTWADTLDRYFPADEEPQEDEHAGA